MTDIPPDKGRMELMFLYLARAFARSQDSASATREAFARYRDGRGRDTHIQSSPPPDPAPRSALRLTYQRVPRMGGTVAPDDPSAKPQHGQHGVTSGHAPRTEPAWVVRRRRRAMRDAIAALPTDQRRCILAWAQGMKLREMEKYLGIDYDRATVALGKAILKLSKFMP